MGDSVTRESSVAADREEVWEAITGDGWLAEEVELDLRPGGDAVFRDEHGEKRGWIEDVFAPERLAFWWAIDGEPATRVELSLIDEGARTRIRVVETRPLEMLDLIGTPLPRVGRRTFGPALVAA